MGDQLDWLTTGPVWIQVIGAVVVLALVATLIWAVLVQGRGAKFGSAEVDPLRSDGLGTPAKGQPPAGAAPEPEPTTTPPADTPPRPSLHSTLLNRPAAQNWQRRADEMVDHDELFGVEKLIETVVTAVQSDGHRSTVSLFGEGGIGKTAVAYEVTKRCATSNAFSHVAWIPAMGDPTVAGAVGSSTGDTQVMAASAQLNDVVPLLARQFGISLGQVRYEWPRDFADQFAGLPADVRALVVLDGVESLREGDESISYLHGRLGLGYPHRTLVTTRRVLATTSRKIREIHLGHLSEGDALALITHLGRDSRDILDADRHTLQPVIEVTGGNPYLIRLVIHHFLTTHRPLDRVLDELTSLGSGGELAGQVSTHLYRRSLEHLRNEVGAAAATALIHAFCGKRRGETFSFEELAGIVEPQTPGRFPEALQTACQLALVSATKADRRYSIHSLLHEFTCRVP